MPKGIPRRDGSGRGVRANRGRGGCLPPQDKAQYVPPIGRRGRRNRIR